MGKKYSKKEKHYYSYHFLFLYRPNNNYDNKKSFSTKYLYIYCDLGIIQFYQLVNHHPE